jgi:hypothetical protein
MWISSLSQAAKLLLIVCNNQWASLRVSPYSGVPPVLAATNYVDETIN